MYLSHLYWETGLKDTTTIEREPRPESINFRISVQKKKCRVA